MSERFRSYKKMINYLMVSGDHTIKEDTAGGRRKTVPIVS